MSVHCERCGRTGRVPIVLLAVWLCFLGTGLAVWRLNWSIPFESAGWKANKANHPRMIDDLLSKKILDNLTEPEVEKLLGPPSLVRDGVYVYWAGDDGVIDDMWLEIEIQDGRVSKTRHVPD